MRKLPPLLANGLNALAFQGGWFACVFASQHPLLLLVPLGALALHLSLVAHWRQELPLVAAVALLGAALDSLLLNLGLFDFAGESRWAPLWLILLWALLATTLRHCLAWSARPLWLSALLGALGGPLSYYAGARLADVGLPLGQVTSLALLAAIWALVFPLLHTLAARLAPAR
ncbi:hypothetical protein A7D27_21890 [Pseudomonas sp. 1D4]|uniref:DUF2878 family protein n=1 Tax=Pseudomonadaceae TaxID=135621 RepID=UPI00084A92FE|nr:hypothetical protein A7D27_21890 [Pseudomonas sp. 1D4]